MNEVNEVA